MCCIDKLSFWGRRYAKEGPLWGYEPSLTARELDNRLGRPTSIVEVGFGYGRDLDFLASRGHELTGVESPGVFTGSTALATRAKLHSNGLAGFAASENAFGGLLAHRVWHLLDREDRKRLARLAAFAVRPGGILAISFRDERGFDARQMEWIGERRARYRFRPEHTVEFWRDSDVQSAFGSAFESFRFVNTHEVESLTNPEPCAITAMLAIRTPCPSRPANQARPPHET